MKKRKVLAVLLCAAMTAATRAVIHQAHPMM